MYVILQRIFDVRSNPGFALVAIACALLMFAVVNGSRAAVAVTYTVLGLACFLGLSGVWLMARQLRHFYARPEAPDALEENIEHTIKQLSKNYDILRQQATQGFIMAAVVMILGLLVILAGAAGAQFGFVKAGSLTTVAGVVTEAVSGMGLYLFNKTFDRLNTTSDRLQDTWRLLEAFKKAETLTDDLKKDVLPTLIKQLAMPQAYTAASQTTQLRKGRKSTSS